MNSKSDPVYLLNFGEAARRLSVSLRQFRRIVDDGRIAVIRVTERTPRVLESDVRAFVASVTSQKAHQ